jgi:lysophospholipase L1-like esterase
MRSPHRLLPLAALLLAGFLLPACSAPVKVACVGNSITYGYGLDRPDLESYPVVLDTLLGSGYSVTNFGVSGKTMIKEVGDAYWSQPAFTAALDSLPGIVVIELGTNDSKTYIWPYYGQDFKPDYEAMIDTFRTLASQPQVWVTLQPRANDSSWNIFDTTIANEVNPDILEVALLKAAPVIDLRTAMAGHPEWFQADSVHPDSVGARALAGIVAAMLLRTPATVSSQGGTLIASKGYGFQWYRNDTMLVGDTAASLAEPLAGSYKVSVKVDSGSNSRLVSAAVAASPATGLARTGRDPSVRVSVSASGAVRIEAPTELGPLALRVWNLNGRQADPQALSVGVYRYRLSGRDFSQTGSLVLPR